MELWDQLVSCSQQMKSCGGETFSLTERVITSSRRWRCVMLLNAYDKPALVSGDVGEFCPSTGYEE